MRVVVVVVVVSVVIAFRSFFLQLTPFLTAFLPSV
jgi:hypothetical protein